MEWPEFHDRLKVLVEWCQDFRLQHNRPARLRPANEKSIYIIGAAFIMDPESVCQDNMRPDVLIDVGVISGVTMGMLEAMFPDAVHWALVDRQKEGEPLADTWVIFPWE
jgi:hypothetical protein